MRNDHTRSNGDVELRAARRTRTRRRLGSAGSAFAGLLLLATGAFDVIGGIALLAKNDHLDSGLFWSSPFWGVVFLVVGGVTLYAGFAF